MESLGTRVTKLRRELDISQKELAQKCNITEASLSRYENDLREPKGEIIVKLSNALNVTTDYLLGRTDERKPKKEINNATTIAAHRLGDIEQLPDDAIDEINNYIDLMRLKYLKDKNNE